MAASALDWRGEPHDAGTDETHCRPTSRLRRADTQPLTTPLEPGPPPLRLRARSLLRRINLSNSGASIKSGGFKGVVIGGSILYLTMLHVEAASKVPRN